MDIQLFLNLVLSKKEQILEHMQKDQGFRMETISVKEKFRMTGAGCSFYGAEEYIFSPAVLAIFDVEFVPSVAGLCHLRAKNTTIRIVECLYIKNLTHLFVCQEQSNYFFLIGRKISEDPTDKAVSFVILSGLSDSILQPLIGTFALFQIEQGVKELYDR